MAKAERRLDTNAPGDFYVDDSCIDCGTCRWMAPASFDQAGGHSRVYAQPGDDPGTTLALKALVACPTASIGTAQRHDVKAVASAFPDPIDADAGVYHCGYHHEDSYGAASYLVVRPGGNVLVDSPRFAAPLVRGIEALGGVRWMFLTHRDDVAEHAKFAGHFGCERVLHRADVGRSTQDVELQLHGGEPISLAPDLTVIPVPGHTRGSACLLYRDEFLFSGDHAAWSIPMQRIYAFRGACWYDWGAQINSMRRLELHRFEHILPGHSAPCRFPAEQMQERMAECVRWMESRR